MKAPENKAGELTGKIMKNFSRWSDNCVIDLSVEDFNIVFNRVYNLLNVEINKLRESQNEMDKNNN